MVQEVESVGDAIEKLGGSRAVEAIFRVSTQAVSNWRVADRFPAYTYLEVSARLKRLGFSCPSAFFAFRRAPDDPAAGAPESSADISRVPT